MVDSKIMVKMNVQNGGKFVVVVVVFLFCLFGKARSKDPGRPLQHQLSRRDARSNSVLYSDLTPKKIVEYLHYKGDISVLKLFSVRTWRDIKVRSELPHVNAYIQEKAKSYYQMNIKVAFRLLGNVAQLLRVSYAGCKGYSCSTKVLEVLSSYQTLISEAKSLSSHFVQLSIRAIRYHAYAHIFARRRQDSKAIKAIKRTIKLAEDISIKTRNIAVKSRRITRMLQEAMLDASKQEQLSILEKKNVERRLFNETINKQLIRTLKKLIKVDREKIRDDVHSFKTLAHDLLHTLRTHVNKTVGIKKCELVDTNVKIDCRGVSCLWKRYETITVEREFCNVKLNEKLLAGNKKSVDQLKTLLHNINETQLSIQTKQSNLTQLYMFQYKSLERSLVELKHSTLSQNELVTAVHSLEIAVKALSIVKTAFEKAVEFWTSVVLQTEQLNNEDMELVLGLGLQEFILESGFSWLTLGKVQLEASDAMKDTVRRVDRNLMDLPTSAEVSAVISSEADGIMKITRSLMERLYEDEKDVILVHETFMM